MQRRAHRQYLGAVAALESIGRFERTGLLVEPHDGEAIARAVDDVLRAGSAFGAMGKQARDVAPAQLSIDAKMAQTITLCRLRIAARGRGRRGPRGLDAWEVEEIRIE